MFRNLFEFLFCRISRSRYTNKPTYNMKVDRGDQS